MHTDSSGFGQDGRNAGSLAFGAGYRQFAASGFHPMAHAGQAVTANADGLGVEALAVIRYVDADVAIEVFESDACLFGFSVFSHVGQ